MATSKQYIFVKTEGDLVYYKSADPAIAGLTGEVPIIDDASTRSFLIENVESC